MKGAAPRRTGSARNIAKTLVLMATFVASTAVMLLTRSVVVVAIWVGVWVFAMRANTGTRGFGLLMFYVGFLLFYPSVLNVGGSLHLQNVVATCILGAMVFTSGGTEHRSRHAGRWFRFLVLGWFLWGTLAYAPVVMKWLMVTVLEVRGPDWLGDIFYETSVIKSAGRTILAAAAALLAVRALRTPADFHAFQKWLFVGAAVLMLLSTMEAVTARHLVPNDYEADPSRLVGFSVPDPNGYGRSLLLPTIFAVAFVLNRKRETPVWVWPLTLAAFGSIALTMSRTTYFSVTAGTFVLLALNRARLRTLAVTIVLAGAMTIVISSFGLTAAFAEGSERRSLSSITSRIEIYASIVEILRDRPWFGTHPGGYLQGLASVGHRMPDQDFDYEMLHFETPHNMLLAVAVEYGIPMAAILVLVLVTTAIAGLRARRLIRRVGHVPWRGDLDVFANAAIALSVAYFVHGLTEVGILDAIFLTLGLSVATWLFVTKAVAESRRAAAVPAAHAVESPARGERS